MTVEAERHDRKLEEFLKSVGAANYPHVHDRSLYDHLKGTRDILRCWSQPFAIQTAGLLHSIYSTDVYRLQVLNVSEREWLQTLFGKDAERLAYLFHKLPRQTFFDRLRNCTSISSEGLVVPLETADGVVDLVVSAREAFGLVVVHMANEAEQVCLADGKPGLWLARVSELGTVSLSIQAKQKIAIVGFNGAGKTTLLKLMLRLLEPDEGTITFRGVDEIAKNAPQGYETQLGKEFLNGTDLSGGQWQKVALARGFVRDASVIFLDEPTASVDPKTEKTVFEQLLSLAEGKTAIVISHRLFITPLVDHIFVLEQGRLIEQGTHGELMERDGVYAGMYKTQAGMYWPRNSIAS